MVGATGVAALGVFLPQAELDQVFDKGHIPTASISFFPAGRAVREKGGYRLNGRWRFNSGIQHSEWVLGGTVVEGTESENGGRPLVIFAVMPRKDVTLYDNWRDVVGLKGTGSCDCSVENYHLPEHFSFVWDLLKPKPRRGGPAYLLPPFSFVAKEHGSVAVGGARRALDELINLATTTRGTFRSSTCYRAGQFSLAQDAENFRAERIVPTPLPRNPRATTPTGIYDRPQVGLSVKQIIGLIDDQRRVFAINRTVYAGTGRFDADKRFRHQKT